jgi:hypothetical protein
MCVRIVSGASLSSGAATALERRVVRLEGCCLTGVFLRGFYGNREAVHWAYYEIAATPLGPRPASADRLTDRTIASGQRISFGQVKSNPLSAFTPSIARQRATNKWRFLPARVGSWARRLPC